MTENYRVWKVAVEATKPSIGKRRHQNWGSPPLRSSTRYSTRLIPIHNGNEATRMVKNMLKSWIIEKQVRLIDWCARTHFVIEGDPADFIFFAVVDCVSG